MSEHYYTESPSSPMRFSKISATLRGELFEFYTASGVFSVRKVDRGTKILVENIVIGRGNAVLDLACGYGVVGVVVKKHFPSAKVVMTDINRRAVNLAKRNIELNGVKAIVYQGEGYAKLKDRVFDTILLNPPQTAGREVCFKMIEWAPHYLKEGGTLQIVARHKKGGKVLSEKMESVFGNLITMAKKAGYRVYLSRKE